MQVYSTLYHWIAQGHYAPGSRLEPEKTLCEIFGVSRITIRKAIEMLVNEGLVSNAQGRGNFVRDDYVNTAVRADMDDRISTARAMARKSKIDNLQIAETTSPEICAELKLPVGTLLRKVTYVRVLEDGPVGYIESWFPADIEVSLNATSLKRSTMLTILEDQGIKLSGIDHLVGATLADTQLARYLDTNVGAPLVRVKMLMLDCDSRGVETVRAYFRADKYEHHMFMTR